MTAPGAQLPPLHRIGRFLRRLRRQVLIRRRLLAVLFTVVAVAAGLQAVAAPAPATVPLSVATRDLPAGTVLATSDLTDVLAAPESVPDGAVPATDLVGETLAAPLRRGEALTDLRLVGPSYLVGQEADLSALPVRISDPGAAELVEPGERIDLIATDPTSGRTRMLARDALVLAVPAAADATNSVADGSTGRLVVVGIPAEDVSDMAGAAARLFLSVAFPQ